MKSAECINYRIQRAAVIFVVFFASCTAAPLQAKVQISPVSMSFGNQSIGAASSPMKMTLTNATGHDTTIVSISSSVPQFSYSWPSLPVTLGAAQQLTGTVAFKPAASQIYNGTLTIAFASGPSIVVSLSGTGVPAQTAVAIQPASATVMMGQTATFSASVSGATPTGYQWKKNGAAITGATAASYTTPPTTTSDNAAQFIVTVATSTGSMSSNPATLTVTTSAVAPSITSQPASQTVAVGQAATFSVAAAGTAPLSYKWMKNGTLITGAASPTYTTPATTTSDSGSKFSVMVSDSAGNVTSNPATLTVNTTASQLTANPATLSFGNVNVGANSSQNVTLTNSGSASITISNVSMSGPGFTVSGVSSGLILAAGKTATLDVTFAPTASGSDTGSVTVTSNATNSPAKISLSGTGTAQTNSAFKTWVAPGLVRVGPSDAPGTTSSLSLSGARGEYVDAQIIVNAPAGGLTNVNMSASNLTGPNGASIAVSNFTFYREYYIAVTGTTPEGGSNPPLGSGTYPEPLIPFNDPETGAALTGSLKAVPATVAANQNQPFWIDLSIPRGAGTAPPGTYSGTITVTSTQGNVSVPVSLTVWNFELPLTPTEKSLWTLWSPASGDTVQTLDRALMRNKVMGWYDAASSAASDVANFGLNRSGLDGLFYIGMSCSGSFSSLPSSAQIASAAATFPTGLPLDMYAADELQFPNCNSAVGPLQTLAANAHAHGVKVSLTTDAPYSGLYGTIDNWILLDSVQKWPTVPYTGQGALWSYTSCNVGFGNTPEWMVDYPPINERIQAGFLDWTQGATGLLYYRSDGWSSGNAIGSWNNVNVSACGAGTSDPGDGVFLYPPAPIGSTEPAPGIRLKSIRDGIQDYEYVQILNSLGQSAFANSVIQPIATSWTSWTHDPNALAAARTQLGQKLDQLSPPSP